MIPNLEYTHSATALYYYQYIEVVTIRLLYCKECSWDIIQLNTNCLHEETAVKNVDHWSGPTCSNKDVILEVKDATRLVVKFDCRIQRATHVVILIKIDCEDVSPHTVVDHFWNNNELAAYISYAPCSCRALE